MPACFEISHVYEQNYDEYNLIITCSFRFDLQPMSRTLVMDCYTPMRIATNISVGQCATRLLQRRRGQRRLAPILACGAQGACFMLDARCRRTTRSIGTAKRCRSALATAAATSAAICGNADVSLCRRSARYSASAAIAWAMSNLS
jgi:hypothetical protein